MGGAFQLEELDGRIALVTFGVPEKKVNTLSRPVLSELADLVAQLDGRDDLRGLLFRSGKPGQFIAGADLNELGALVAATREQIAEALYAGHELFDRISQLPFPTVALIDGPCMGGGTELVLAMDERIASNSPATKIALPEVTIGLIPGWGGTQRLPRLIGVHHAIEMICGGAPVSAGRARELGLVFDAVPAEELVSEGRRLIELLHESHGRVAGSERSDGPGGTGPSQSLRPGHPTADSLPTLPVGEAHPTWQQDRARRRQPLGLSDDQMHFAFAVAEGQLRGKTKGQYPAPLAALKAIREGINRPLEEALQVERETALEVVGTPVSANLIGLFFMNQRLARDPGVDDPNITPRTVNRVGVVGAGLMGAGIATAHARRKIPSRIVDTDDERLASGLARAEDVVASRIKIGRATPQDMVDMLAHLSTSTSHQIFADCDVVIEAVTENEQLKTSLYRELADDLRDDAILASNTSTISITRMAQSAPAAERFAGMHFFYPVDRMQLVEVIRGEKTSDETVATLVALAKRIGKTPIVVKDCPGFLVNRILLPYMNESLVLLLEGASMDQIDRVATEFGMPMGPIALHDLVGLDTAYYAGQVMLAGFRDRAVQVPLLKELVEKGRLGQKSGAGFRKFVGKKSRPIADPEIEALLEQSRLASAEARVAGSEQSDGPEAAQPGLRKASDPATRRELTSDDWRLTNDAEAAASADRQSPIVNRQSLADRLFLPMLLEATRCLEEGIVREPAHVDMGLILGIGFPSFRGGLLRWCDTEGAGNILKRLERYTPLGKRFEPTETLLKMAAANERFYPRAKAV